MAGAGWRPGVHARRCCCSAAPVCPSPAAHSSAPHRTPLRCAVDPHNGSPSAALALSQKALHSSDRDLLGGLTKPGFTALLCICLSPSTLKDMGMGCREDGDLCEIHLGSEWEGGLGWVSRWHGCAAAVRRGCSLPVRHACLGAPLPCRPPAALFAAAVCRGRRQPPDGPGAHDVRG